MSNLISWAHFDASHEDKHMAFEGLCRALFREKFCREVVVFHSNPNNPGIEVEPVTGCDGKLISFQAKYFDNRVAYKQILSSAKEIIKAYAEKIDCVYLYCNKTIDSRSKDFVEAKKLLQDNGILLVLITDAEILDEVRQYPSIMSFYFGRHIFSKDWFNRKIETTIKNLGGRYNIRFNIPTHIQEKVKLFLGYEDAIDRINDRKNSIHKHIDYLKGNKSIKDSILEKIYSFPELNFQGKCNT